MIISVDEYTRCTKGILRRVHKMEAEFNAEDDYVQEEWARQIEDILWYTLEVLMKCTTKRQALQVTAISKRFHKHKDLFKRLGVHFP